MLESLFGEVGAGSILGDVPAGAALDVTVNIGYRSKRRRIDRSMLSDIGTRVRNLGDGEVKIRGRNGSAHGDDARLHMKMPWYFALGSATWRSGSSVCSWAVRPTSRSRRA